MKLTLAVLLTIATAVAHAGEVGIGYDTMNGGTKLGTCHSTTFQGPRDAVQRYTKLQKDRFEQVDAAVIEQLGAQVSVRLDVVTYKQAHCAQNSGVPERIILTEKNGDVPILTIPLKAEPVKLGNMAGAEFTAMEANGNLSLADVKKLVGKEYDFHLIYSDHKYKDKWKKDYAEKILK